MKVLKTIFLTAAATLIWGQAQAWTATAVGGNASFTVYNSGTRQEAEAGALQDCHAKNSGCKLLDKPVRETAVVVAKGTEVGSGWGYSANPNPRIAANEAMSECKKVAKNCRLVSASWDSGATWGALAMGADTFFAHVGADTKAEAESEALKGCERDTAKAGSCKIKPEFSTDHHAYVSIAKSKSSSGISFYETPEKAKRGAIEQCEKGKTQGETCVITDVAENRGATPEPAGMKQLAAELENAKLKESKAVVSKTTYRTVLSCTNQCLNDRCVRTFSNGHKENWQAPRVYDPFTNSWKWDVTTNACGG